VVDGSDVPDRLATRSGSHGERKAIPHSHERCVNNRPGP
jgi:hypothetical protein